MNTHNEFVLQSKRTSSDFPTPELLMAAQIKYAKANAGKKKNGTSGVPEPFPPPTLKAEIYNESNYKQVDDNARKVSCNLLFV
jgi:hypothetical protein